MIGLVLLGACGDPGYPFATADDVRVAVDAVYTPVYLALAAEIVVTSPTASATGCPAVTFDGTTATAAGPCTDGVGTSIDGRFVVDGIAIDDAGAVSPADDGTITWDGYATTDAGGTLVARGTQTWHIENPITGELRSNLRLGVTGVPGDPDTADDAAHPAPIPSTGDYVYDGLVFTFPSASLQAPDPGAYTYDVHGDVTVPTLGPFSARGSVAEGSATDGTACTAEPLDGSLVLTGEAEETVTFDGENLCDGLSPLTGAVTDELAWKASPLGGCDHVGSGDAAVAALGAIGLRRRRDRTRVA